MTYTIGVEIRRYATVAIDAETEEEAFALAGKKAVESPEEADWNDPVVDTCEIISTIEDFSPMYDRAYEERREEMIA